MNFLTAEVEIVVDFKKLETQLAKVRAKVMKSTAAMEKSHKAVHKALTATIRYTKDVLGSTIEVEKVLGRWSTAAWNFHRKMVRNLLILKKVWGLAKHIGTALGAGLAWGARKLWAAMPESLLMSMKEVAKGAKEVNKGFEMPSLKMLLHPLRTLRLAWAAWNDEGQKAAGLMGESMEEVAISTEAATEAMNKMAISEAAAAEATVDMADAIERENVALREASRLAEIWLEVNMEEQYQIEAAARRIAKRAAIRTEGGASGEIVYDIGGVMVEAYGKMYKAAKWALEGIGDVAETVWSRVSGMISWRTAGITATIIGMYYKVTQAAMDVEDKLSFAEKGPTRQSLARLKEAFIGLAAAIGKPFLANIKTISAAIAAWLDKNRERFVKWSQIIVGYVGNIQRAFVAWVKYLTTDWRGGVKVATDVVLELFKGLGESIVAILSTAGKKAGLALVKGLIGGIAGAAASETERATGLLESILKKLMKSSEASWKQLNRFTGIPSGQDTLLPFTPGTRFRTRTPEEQEAEGLSKRLLRIAKDRAANIKQLLEGMPTWMPPSAEIEVSAKAVMEADTAMAEHRRMLSEQAGTLSEMQYRIDVDRITHRMEAESQAAKEIEKVWNEMYLKQEEAAWHAMRAPIIAAEKLANESAERRKRIAEDIASSMARSWSRAIDKMMFEGAKFWDAMKDMARSLIRDIAQIIIYKQVTEKIAYGIMGLPIPTAEHGGYVEKTGLAVIHKGETYSGVGGGGGGGITINVNNVPEGYTISEAEEYMFGDQRIIDVSMQAAEGNGSYRRAHRL